MAPTDLAVATSPLQPLMGRIYPVTTTKLTIPLKFPIYSPYINNEIDRVVEARAHSTHVYYGRFIAFRPIYDRADAARESVYH